MIKMISLINNLFYYIVILLVYITIVLKSLFG